MPKILHVADIHLGMKNYGTVDRETGLNSRYGDFLRSFDFVVEQALKNKVDFFLFAGDAFKTREPSPTQQREFAKRIKKVAAAGIPVIMVIGNHDLPNATGKADSLEIYKTLAVDNVYISQEPELLTFAKTKIGWQLKKSGRSRQIFQIATLPWITKSKLATKNDYQAKTIDEVHQLMTRQLTKIVKDLGNQVDQKQPAALVAHATVAGASFGAERKVYIGDDVVLSQAALTKPWNYVALGHLHQHQVLKNDPPVIYSGSIERVDFGEAKEAKGFVLAEIKPQQKTTYKFIPTPARKFIAINISLTEKDKNPTGKICAAIGQKQLEEAIVKINLTLPESTLGLIDNDKIHASLENAHYIAGINKEIITTTRLATHLENIEQVAPEQALTKYLSTKGRTKKQIQSLQILAKKLIDAEN
ncbi:MAG: exonuclease SbcCD subunit D [Parcubacteria group bacterium]